jgi:hypothetical protein
MIYADDVNLPGYNIDATKKNMETLIDANKEVGLEVNTEKTKHMLLSHHQKAGKYYDIKIAHICFENVANYRYMGQTVTNQNLIHEEIKRRLNVGNACYHSVQNLLPSHLLSKNIKIIFLSYLMYGAETFLRSCQLCRHSGNSQQF